MGNFQTVTRIKTLTNGRKASKKEKSSKRNLEKLWRLRSASPDDRAFTIKSLCFLFSPTQSGRLKPFRPRDRNRSGNRRLGFNGSCARE